MIIHFEYRQQTLLRGDFIVSFECSRGRVSVDCIVLKAGVYEATLHITFCITGYCAFMSTQAYKQEGFNSAQRQIISETAS